MKKISEDPNLLLQWDYKKNEEMGLSPETVSLGSNKKVWWICPKGHSFDMRPTERNRGYGCPYCSGHRAIKDENDLATTIPEALKYWDYEKNTISPDQVSHGSNKMVWWKCENGHSYEMQVHKRVSRSLGSCPICSGHRTVSGVNDFATCYPEIAKEWHPEKNGIITPNIISKKNGTKYWWKCHICGHEWQATPHDRADGTGCPKCANRYHTSFFEQAVYFYVKKVYPNTINGYRDIFDNGMELDIYVPDIKLGIEFDGINWHQTDDAKRREREKFIICEEKGIKLIRISETDERRWDISNATYHIRKKNKKDLEGAIQDILNRIDPESNMWTRKNPLKHYSDIIANIERDEIEIRSSYMGSIPNSLVDLRPDLVEEWNYNRNGNLKPEMFGINSNDKVWWKCKTCGHEWQTTVIHRGGKRNSGCPECAKTKKGKSFTARRVSERGSLVDNNPDLAREWHPTKNGDLRPADITEKRFKNVWWLCPVCGYEWEASPNARTGGCGCPCCSGRVPKEGENDLKTRFPDLVREWDYEKNGDRGPESYLPGSGKKVWWKCSICGHEWEAIIKNRTKGSGCPNWRHHVSGSN